MAVTHQGVFVQTPKITPITIVNADGTGLKVVATAGADGSKVVGLQVSSDDAARVLQVWLTRAATNYLLATVDIAALAGFDGIVPVVDAMNTTEWPGLPVDNDGQRYFFLESGDTLSISVTVAVTAAKTIYGIAHFGNF